MPGSALRVFFASLFFGLFFFGFSKTSFADTTLYRSAETVTTDTTISSTNHPYANLSNCSITDGITCDRPYASGYGNLYFQNFGDFGIPEGATITHIRIRVTGKAQTPSLALFASLSKTGPGPLPTFCQSPSDLWRMYALNSSTITEYNVTTPLTNGNLAACLTLSAVQANNFIFNLHYANGSAWSANIDNFEIAFDYTVAPTPTPSPSPTLTPTPTPTPTPIPPAPFLDLPWSYGEKGLSFNEAALNINSFFDHEYPLLSTGLTEPSGTGNSIMIYEGPPRSTDNYSSHDGYDYGTQAKAEFGNPVLAAAAGTARFVNSCGPCGNAIHIDHGNGFQTRYYHLQEEGLITNVPGQSVQIDAGQQIGKVGATGNVRPAGEDGAHIHFMVVEDKNNDENFDDNIPDGLVDPFGWQSKEADPWENFEFFYNGQNRMGNRSYYLWNKKIDGLNANLSANGGVFNSGRNSVDFPQGATNQNLLLEIISAPAQKLSDLITSIGSTVQIIAQDSLGNPVTSFNAPFTVGINFAGFDLSRFLIDTISIYSSSDGITWQKEPTTVDLLNQKATTEVKHLTQFALMAERADVLAATTTAVLAGDEGAPGWFRADLSVSLVAEDNESGLGVNYILYRSDDGDWQKYINPFQFNQEGQYALEFYSVDNDENIEEKKRIEFNIDKTPPEAEIKYNPATLDLDIIGIDSSGSAVVNVTDLPKNKKSIKITDQAGNVLEIIGKGEEEEEFNSSITIDTLRYNFDPLINLDSAKFQVNYSLENKTSALRQLEQKYEVKGELKIKLIYSSKTDRTTVITKVKGKEKAKEELPGIRILQLTTENGTLKYSY